MRGERVGGQRFGGATGGVARVSRRPVSPPVAAAASRGWWDAEADAYQAEHGDFLGPARFVWCPEGLDEADARLLGDVRGKLVLEVGCGAAQCARWLVREGATVCGVDLSWSQLGHARALAASTGLRPWLVLGDATRLPVRDGSVDLACSAFGALPFVADPGAVMREVARVLRPGGRWVFSVTHPFRWCFPDDPGPQGLVARESYFDRRPYVEEDAGGEVRYVETHRTFGDRVGDIVAAGLQLEAVVEPEWPAGHERSWGQWSPLRGRLLPGTAIFVTRRAPAGAAGGCSFG